VHPHNRRGTEGELMSAGVITVTLAGGWTAPCKACGVKVSWRTRPGGGLEKFNADPRAIRIYRNLENVPVQDLSAEDLHAPACDPEHRPRPLFTAGGMF